MTIARYCTADQPIGRKIESVRLLRNMTQKEVANLVGITKEGYGKIERSNSISESRLFQIASALRVTAKGLLEFREDKLYTSQKEIKDSSALSENSLVSKMLSIVEQIAQAQAQLIFVKQEIINLLKERASYN